MWWIPVVAAVTAVLALILFSPVKIRVFTQNGVNATARYLILKRELYPAPPKKEKKKKPAKEQKKKEKPKKEQPNDLSNILDGADVHLFRFEDRQDLFEEADFEELNSFLAKN